MYLPLSLSLTTPYFAQWTGESGKRYEFAVVGAEQKITLDQPVVFVFAKHGGPRAEVLFIGHGDRFSLLDNQTLASAWLEARELGMTHLHLRFDAVWDHVRESETADLVAGHRPPLNEQNVDSYGQDEIKEETARLYYFPDVAGQRAADIERSLCGSDAVQCATDAPALEGKPSIRHRASLLPMLVQSLSRFLIGWRARRSVVREVVPVDPLRVGEELGERPTKWSTAEGISLAPEPPLDTMVMAEAASSGSLDRVLPGGTADSRLHIDDVLTTEGAQEPAPVSKTTVLEKENNIRARLGWDLAARVYLYAGDFSYQDGIDILTEALITVCRTDERAYFLLIGSGELRGKTEEMVFGAGLRARCCLPGDLSAGDFANFLDACDYVVIPGREARGAQLPSLALGLGKPILTTHQAKLSAVIHGQNGLVAYDNPNSLVWGLRELAAMAWSDKLMDWAGDREREVA